MTTGLQLHKAYSVAEIRAIDHDLRPKLEVILLPSRNRYLWFPASIAEDDGATVLAPSGSTVCRCCSDTGRWLVWQVAATAGDGGGALSDDDPLPDALTADPGVSSEASRSDHVHPLPDAADPIDVVVDAELVKQEIVKTDAEFSTGSTTGAAVTGTTINLTLDEETEVMIFVSGPLYYLGGGDGRVDGFLGVKVNSNYYFGGHANSSNLGLFMAAPGSFAKVITLAAGSHTIDAALKSLGTNNARLLIDADRPLTLEVVYLEKTIETIVPSFGSGMQPSDDDPLPLAAVADPGVSAEASRSDHVHPRDGMATEVYADAAADAAQAAAELHADNLVAGLSWKQKVVAATTGAGTLATDFESGDTIDGVVLGIGDRILIKNQAAPAENGIYIVAAAGAPTRAPDANSATELESAAVFVDEGTANAGSSWVQTADNFVLETDPIAWAQFDGKQITAGTGLVRTGNVIGIAPLGITDAEVATANKDGTVATPSMRTIGTGAQQAAAGDTSPAAILTTKGDLLGRDATAPKRVPVAAEDGKVLHSNDSDAEGVSWAYASSFPGGIMFGSGEDGSLTLVANTTVADATTTIVILQYETLDIAIYSFSQNANDDPFTIMCSVLLTGNGGLIWNNGNVGGASGGVGAGGGGSGGAAHGGRPGMWVFARRTTGTGTISGDGGQGGAGANATVATATANGAAGVVNAATLTLGDQGAEVTGVISAATAAASAGAGGGGGNGTYTQASGHLEKYSNPLPPFLGAHIIFVDGTVSGGDSPWFALNWWAVPGGSGGAGARNTGAQGGGGGGSSGAAAGFFIGSVLGAAGGAGLAGAPGAGGGGGGAGGPGGLVVFVTLHCSAGWTVSSNGGQGGNGGDGFGNGGGGAAGPGGPGGWVMVGVGSTSYIPTVSVVGAGHGTPGTGGLGGGAGGGTPVGTPKDGRAKVYVL